MIMKEVMIDVRSVQQVNGDEQSVEFSTVGKLGISKDGVLMSYEEPDGMVSAGSETTVRFIQPGNVIIFRKGDQQSRIDVIAGVRNSLYYNTPFGSIMLGVYGESVKCDIDKNGGSLDLVYTIDSNLQHVSRNKVEITVREV